MQVITNIGAMKQWVKETRFSGEKIGFVPTMGYWHDGHLSLIRCARKECNKVVASIFVNPTQFRPGEDFEKYPRDLKRDYHLAEQERVDIIFVPTVLDMYPKDFCTFVTVERLGEILCGKFRPGHFQGVATVVNKLFNIIQPDTAYFGQKDAQQTVVIKKMVVDLDMDVVIKELPIVREKDGLAMSSRNIYLSPGERRAARVLYRALQRAATLIANGERKRVQIIAKMEELITKEPLAKIDYVAIVNAETMEEKNDITGEVLVALAAKIGNVRLIDNIKLAV